MSLDRRVDFDVHGLAGIRLVNPPHAAEVSMRQGLGLPQVFLGREPDITIRFENHLPPSRLCVLGADQYAYSGNDFFILNGSMARGMVRIPLEQVGNPCEIVTDQSSLDITLLLEIIKLNVLTKGFAAVHGAALVFNGQSVLFTSWSKGGKTTAALGFISLGADYIGDDCVLLGGRGEGIYGIPSPLELSPRHLDVMPSLRSKFTLGEKIRADALRSFQQAHRVLNRACGESLAARGMQRLVSALQRRWSVRLSPLQTFGSSCALWAHPPKKVFVLVSHQETVIEIERIPVAEFIQRLAVAIREELRSLTAHYQAFRYAFPGRMNPLIENAPDLAAGILTGALSNCDAYVVRHPYPLRFPEFYSALRPCLQCSAGWATGALETEAASPAIRVSF